MARGGFGEGSWYNGDMNVFSPAKINATLRVLGRRSDGFHELDSVVVPLGLGDDVGLERAEGTSLEMVGEGVDLSAMPEDIERNLAVRAVRLLERAVGRALPTRLFIRKRIPLGGGLGGGSSNAAAVLRGMDALWGLGLGRERLCALGAELGSDVALFVLDGTVRMRGRGERVERLPMAGAKPLWVVLANDGSHCATARVYGALRAGALRPHGDDNDDDDDKVGAERPEETGEAGAERLACHRHCARHCSAGAPRPRLTKRAAFCDTLLLSLRTGVAARVADGVGNDLEAPCFGLFPGVARTAEALRAAGCAGVTLCGSGATVFGLVGSREEGERALAHPALAGCWRACTQTLPDGVMAAHGPLTPIVMVRIHVGQPFVAHSV